jgi:hypothetical protein
VLPPVASGDSGGARELEGFELLDDEVVGSLEDPTELIIIFKDVNPKKAKLLFSNEKCKNLEYSTLSS